MNDCRECKRKEVRRFHEGIEYLEKVVKKRAIILGCPAFGELLGLSYFTNNEEDGFLTTRTNRHEIIQRINAFAKKYNVELYIMLIYEEEGLGTILCSCHKPDELVLTKHPPEKGIKLSKYEEELAIIRDGAL